MWHGDYDGAPTDENSWRVGNGYRVVRRAWLLLRQGPPFGRLQPRRPGRLWLRSWLSSSQGFVTTFTITIRRYHKIYAWRGHWIACVPATQSILKSIILGIRNLSPSHSNPMVSLPHSVAHQLKSA